MTVHPSQLLAGTRLRAGVGVSTVLPDLDFETYSEAGHLYDVEARKWRHPPGTAAGRRKGLGVVGVAQYVTHPSTEILSLAYNLKDGHGAHLWLPGMRPPTDLLEHLQRGGLVEAWNAAFEWWVWNYVGTRRHGWPHLAYQQMRCAQAKARAASWPGKLEVAGQVMGLTVQKDARGGALLDKFSVPRNPTQKDPRTRHTPADFPEDARILYEYNVTDTVTEAEASSRCPDLEGEELEFWLLDQKINRRGVAIDTEALHNCAFIVEACLAQYNAEMRALTGGAVEQASQLARLREWCCAQGFGIQDGKGSMDDEAIGAYLTQIKAAGRADWAPVQRALELRQLVGSASVKKVFAMRNQVSPWGRLHDLYNYWAAHTGRPTGEGPQPTNLPKAGPAVAVCKDGCGRNSGAHHASCIWCGRPSLKKAAWCPEAMEDVLQVMQRRDLALLEMAFGDAMLCVSGCLRGLFVASPGCDLAASDFSSIEGVVTACLAGEDWRVEMFATHGKAYELSVSKITGIPFVEIMRHAGYEDVERPEWWKHRADKTKPHHPLRQTLGKVAELASGFGGWINAWLRFGAGDFMSEDEIKAAILKWREASPAIVEFWGGQERRLGYGRKRVERYGLEGAAVSAIESPGSWFPVMRLDGTDSGVAYGCDTQDDALYCRLPSGRLMTYRRPRLVPGTRSPLSITFERYNTNPQYGAIGWVRIDTYAGKLAENVVQATARDIQRYAMLNLEKAGYPVVLHVYDEDVCDIPQGWGSVEEMERIMATMPSWATYKGKPWPIRAAGGWRGRRYRKD